jgi:hypothetical protein
MKIEDLESNIEESDQIQVKKVPPELNKSRIFR